MRVNDPKDAGRLHNSLSTLFSRQGKISKIAQINNTSDAIRVVLTETLTLLY